jgi:hypothetical protein
MESIKRMRISLKSYELFEFIGEQHADFFKIEKVIL